MDEEQKSRWNRMFAQAEEFEAVDKIDEARARSREALREITAAQARVVAGPDLETLQRFRHRAERFVQHYDAAYDEWLLGVKQRQERYFERERQDYHQPLAIPADHPKL